MADKRITSVDFVESLNSDESFFINQNNAIKQINKRNVLFGITNGGTGAKTPKEARENLGAISMQSDSITLVKGDWHLGDDELYHNDKNVGNCDGVTEDAVVFISPSPDVNNFNTYTKHNMRCIGQGEKSLFFVANTDPNESDNVTVNYAVLM